MSVGHGDKLSFRETTVYGKHRHPPGLRQQCNAVTSLPPQSLFEHPPESKCKLWAMHFTQIRSKHMLQAGDHLFTHTRSVRTHIAEFVQHIHWLLSDLLVRNSCTQFFHSVPSYSTCNEKTAEPLGEIRPCLSRAVQHKFSVG